MKKKHKVSLFVTIILLIIVAVTGKIYMDKQSFNDEMLNIVKSKKAKEVYEKTLKNRDPKVFTDEGIIHSYKVDYESVEHNPMGGIMLDLIINNKKSLTIAVILEKGNDTKSLRNAAGGASLELSQLLESGSEELVE
ncbi:hypothetical protein UAY_00896 [Enterococcus moraviensis ATCC BAA-383]|uniref:DUF1310 family protein n=1 Tax=Enterococcus moraviensis ATCC BAA-383 TaxID=1158609 RepID=R2R5B5_9ENTE|nr:DUF1310 family protein [Enterococcus moraviensis]EOI02971.1 hypothetical protein UAY_00896 [Enterococcus moraviensis ATCC BAA-383]EOT73974.1 hypothetical protein I586_00970 [Enterococcus moraviensis ATCC BAA-383]OJG63697.1 hypothetical protein RV09_GL002277 [Enterococcus moraviensis]